MVDSGDEPMIPGVLEVLRPHAPELPLIYDSPHSGLMIPPEFRYAVPERLVLISADTHVDALFAQAPATGATLLRALFPRSFMDVNRSLEDLDPSLVEGGWPHPMRDSASARRGMGLIWRYAWGDTPMYAGRLGRDEVEARIERYWRPYHHRLATLLARAATRFGGVWHVDCHSMPSRGHRLSPDPEGALRADFVLGDRHGRSCEPGFTAHVASFLSAHGYQVALNDPFPGAELVSAYADPTRQRHALQIEINRSLYMDEETRQRSAGFDKLARDLAALGRSIADHVRGRLAVLAR